MRYIVCSKKAYKAVGKPPLISGDVKIIIKPHRKKITMVEDDVIGRTLSDEEVIEQISLRDKSMNYSR